MMEDGARLKLVLPGGETRDFPLPIGATSIGRAEENDITLSGTGIAPYHARIVCDASGCRIIDLSAGQGTRVNGRLIAANAARRLLPGDVIEIGPHRLHFEGSPERPMVSEALSPTESAPPPREEDITKERASMGQQSPQRLLFWVLGVLGVLIALGLVGLLVWVIAFRPATPAGVEPTITPIITATSVAAATDTPMVTRTPAAPSPTPTLPLPSPTAGIGVAATFTPVSTIAPTFTPIPATPTGIPTWLPTSPSPWGMVNRSSNVRAGPGTMYPVITQVASGQYVLPLGQSAGYSWLYVQLQDGQLGWIAAYLVNRSPAILLPVVPAPPLPPTPTPRPSTATFTPAPSTPSPWGMVNQSTANVRAGPGTMYPVITQVRYGQYVFLLGQSADHAWLYVQLQDGRLGWIAAYLVNRSPALYLPVVPAPPLPPTPTPQPPTATFTPVPTGVVPPTSTFTPTPPPCPIAIGAPFIAPWAGDVRSTLRCPTAPMVETWTAVERFERGIMFWREDQRMIYVLASDHTWRKYVDNWVEGMEPYACPDVPPPGLVKPQRGFGIVWCNQPGMKELVGWALEEEHGIVTQFQSFEGGEMLRSDDASIYILKQGGWWQRYPE